MKMQTSLLEQHETAALSHTPAPMLNSPIRWVGGKQRLRKYVLDLLPAHTCYVEPFCGAAWVLFGKQPKGVEVINDIDNDLINFFRVVKEQPQALIDSFEWELVSRAEFNRLKELDVTKLDSIQRAHRFYYLIMAGWGGEFKYPRFQTAVKDGASGNRLINAILTLHERIMPVYKRLQTVIIESMQWADCVDRYDSPTTVFYIDPPYPMNNCNYVHNMRDMNDHTTLMERLSKSKGRWIVSLYDNTAVRDLYKRFNFHPIQSASGMKTGDNKRYINQELLITNF